MQHDERPYHARGQFGQPPDTFALACEKADAKRAAASTVEALMYSFAQRAIAALKEAPAQRRLGQLSERQLHEICARLQRRSPQIANPWTPDEVRLLIEAWAICHGQ